MEFTVTPSVVAATNNSMTTKNLPLSVFKVMDLGLTFTSDVNKDTDSTVTQSAGHDEPTYKITEVTIGGEVSQVTEFMEYNITNAVVSAKVTWYFADGTSQTTSVTTISGDTTFTAPSNKTVLSFDVEYLSTEVQSATGGKYALGYEFKPGVITVKAFVDRMEDDASHPVDEITKITNTADLDITYPKWDDTTRTWYDYTPDVDPVTADITVEPIYLPAI